MKNRLFGLIAVVLVLGMGVILGAGLVGWGSQTGTVQAAASVPAAVDRDAGVLVGSVQADGPAAKAGIVRGDIIVEANGKAVDAKTRAQDWLKDLKPGDKLALKVLHGDDMRSVEVTLGDQNGKPFLGIAPAFSAPMIGGWAGKIPFTQNSPKLSQKLSGALVAEVVSGGPADKAGLKAGDMILKVNDQAIDANNDLAKVLQTFKPGNNVKLSVQHQGTDAAADIVVILGENPEKAGQAYLGIQYRMVGAMLDRLPNSQGGVMPQPRQPGQGGTLPTPKQSLSGLVVSEVKAGSPAEKAGLKTKDLITEVNGKATSTAEDFVNLVKAAKPGDVLTLTVTRSGEQNPLKIDVTLAENPDQKGQAYLGVSIGSTLRGFQRGVPNNQPNNRNPVKPTAIPGSSS
jgi:S1-C subfamily serine protease